jgi:hypothetical protein
MSPLQHTKLVIVHNLGLARDVLHIYVALIVFFGSCLLFKWKVGHWKPWIAVLVATLFNEAWDFHDRLVRHTSMYLWGNVHDILNTMLMPTVLMLAARHTALFRRG